MPRQVQVVVPQERAERIMKCLQSEPRAQGVHSFHGPEGVMMIFRCTDKETEPVLSLLESEGVGSMFGCLDIIALQGTRPVLQSQKKSKVLGRKYRVQDRLSIEEIQENIDSQNHLTFNYISFVLVAAMISTVGLATDSAATVVASMLVSPLMGPIMAITFGTAIGDLGLIWRGLRNELWGFALTFLVGIIWGFCFGWFDLLLETPIWHATQELERGNLAAVVTGIGIAIPSGVGVAVATTGGGFAVLVGVAISAALLPPISNAGMFLAYSAVRAFLQQPENAKRGLEIGGFSCALFIVNFIFIFLLALITFKMKRVRKRQLPAPPREKSAGEMSDLPFYPTSSDATLLADGLSRSPRHTVYGGM